MQKVKILLVAATILEGEFLLRGDYKKHSDNIYSIYNYNVDIDLLITGVGATAMSYYLTKQLVNNTYNFAILIGISGAYSKEISIGDVVNVSVERFADLGIITDNKFVDIFDMQLEDENKFPFENKVLKNYTLINNSTIEHLSSVKGNTVQTIRLKVLPQIKAHSDVESMEGACFAYICAQERMPYAQIRSISNYVGDDKILWDIPIAIKNIETVIHSILIKVAKDSSY